MFIIIGKIALNPNHFVVTRIAENIENILSIMCPATIFANKRIDKLTGHER